VRAGGPLGRWALAADIANAVRDNLSGEPSNASSWSRDDHEDGGPTIQLACSVSRCTLRTVVDDVEYIVK
jgi:hypothetical protein